LCLMVAIAASVLPASLISVLAPAIEKSFAFGPSIVGEVTALLYVCSAIAAIASGWAADRFGGRGVLVGSLAGLIAGLLAIGLVRNHSLLIFAVILGGLCSGAIPPACYRLLWDHVAVVRQGSAFGVIQSGFPGAAVFAGLVAPGVSGDFGWRTVFFGTAAVTAIVGYGSYRFFEDADEPDTSGAVLAAPARNAGPPASRAVLALFGTASLLGNAGAGVLTTYFVIYRVSRHESNAVAGFYFALGGLAAVAARLALGRWVDRHRARAGSMTVALLGGGAVGVALVSVPVGWLVVPATILSFGLGWGWSGLMGLIVTRAFAATPGLSAGLVITTAGGAGAAVGPAVASVLLGIAGYPLAWGFAALCSAGGAVTVWRVNGLLHR
jgi:MFS family permease